jgi:hypothetical protein
MLAVGCAKPDKVVKIPSATSELYLTIETFHEGPMVGDDTRIYVHLDRDGQSKKRLVLYGEDLSFSQVKWIDPNSVSLCLTGGLTVEYHNEVTLFVGNGDAKVHTYLSERC